MIHAPFCGTSARRLWRSCPLRLTWTLLHLQPTKWRSSAVEGKFEIIGETLNQLSKLDAALATRIPDLPKIVAFRNQLIHGYATVNVSTVWNIAQNALPSLLDAVQTLLDELQ